MVVVWQFRSDGGCYGGKDSFSALRNQWLKTAFRLLTFCNLASQEE